MEFRQIISAVIMIGIAAVVVRLFLKRKIRTAKLIRWWRFISDRFHDHQFLKVPEFNDNFQENHLFRRVSLYLNSLESLEDSDFTNLFSGANPNDIVLTLNPNQTVVDTFLGARMWWTCGVVSDTPSKSFTLKIRKRDKRRVLRPYLQHIHTVSDEIDLKTREIRLFTTTANGGGRSGRWRCVPFTHPATMETVAMDAEVKNRINIDLDTFLKSKQYYHRLGRVWRRSYLLYGPSGTGKSSFVAALARQLFYDVYDLDLSKVSDDADLKFLLLQTTPRSVILIEDFDKYVAASATAGKAKSGAVTAAMSFSGLLNFMDGVVNACCDERVMVFTMMTKDGIDPAVLRPGRVDVHIHFPMCDFNNFKNLASNYLGVKEHKLFPQVEEMFSSGATLSPAEIGELMMVNRNSPNRALKSVITALQTTSSPVVASSVGGGDSCKTTPKNGFKSGRVSVDGSGDPVDGGGMGCRGDGVGVKEMRKLYGLLRRKSSSNRKSDSFDLGT